MHCLDCARFDPDSERCLDNKVNPESWNQAIEVCNVMGVRVICSFNDYRQRILDSRCRNLTGPPSSLKEDRDTA
jgi:hypothetical protein